MNNTCWVDNKVCHESDRMILGVLNSGVCKDCSRIIGRKGEIEDFFFEVIGEKKDDWVDEESILSSLAQANVLENACFIYNLLEDLQKLLKKHLENFVEKVKSSNNLLEIRTVVEVNRELILVSSSQDTWEEILQILDSEDSDLKIYKDLLVRLDELFYSNHFENSSTFAELISLFREIDQSQLIRKTKTRVFF
ncbi:MAG: hypothetical protein UR79_C0001G0285 [Candidatus Campbellbacteria bacterium GW2011_GWD1_35_49]|nr:MAG: hypothetical protein UR58_C0001G0325 [Candidatus Campbellbacteria bacterium GW2011_OD1_34_28]KKP75188.1 MAG: hypothetical protein UR74_C0001G0044 [Candidatus Campbellbacteria bacterium GW2011_GWD2_35_24]KKP76251.1 MAG: hypothetical protein UR75_C0001G0285 [Candidatus Campbellbacteria bacterium GW2011_GWC2_35_28]KKP77440.1 MAG: hypothetical protein UR76_C0001G0285 [Candidatus Campbellbacteria bacterium GW2011_GWC1_35_31]KKP79369.1 MAG: hypothetical protein UR79_C0001G0285 [Candidatus Cam